MKKNILTTLLAAVLYFLCVGIGVFLGHLVDQTGNMFYAPAFSALVGGSVYMLLLTKVPRFGAITTLGLFMALFFLASMALVPFSQDSPVVLQQMPSLVSATTETESKTPSPSSSLLLAQVVLSFSCGSVPKLTWPLYLRVGNPKNTLTVSWSLQSWTKSFSLFQASS